MSGGNIVRQALLVAGKDLRIEARSRVAAGQILPFGALVLVLFAFALDPDRGVLPRVAPGLLWVTVLLAGLLAISRSFATEGENGVRDALRLSGIDGAALFCGKALAIAAQLVALEVILGAGVVVLYDLRLSGPLVLVAASLAATAGLAAAGTLYGVLAAGLRVRETLFPLLLLPVVSPVMIGSTRAWEAALEGSPSQAWPWVQLLGVFAVIYTTMGWLAFGPLLEET
ncbi:MAG: heme exporter protein CcmB [Acidimicrobiia bacterium]